MNRNSVGMLRQVKIDTSLWILLRIMVTVICWMAGDRGGGIIFYNNL
jgi:hypothetical protein